LTTDSGLLEEREAQDAADTGARPRDHVDEDQLPVDLDADASAGFRIRTDSVGVHPESRPMQDNAADDDDDRRDDNDRGNLVLLPQGVPGESTLETGPPGAAPFVRRLLNLQERQPRIAIGVIDEWLSTKGVDSYGLAGLRKSLTEHGEKLSDAEKEPIEAALKSAEEALKSEDKERIDAAAAELMTASQKIGEKVYAGEQGGAAAAAAAAGAAGAGASAAQDADVVDAEFKEVKRDA
jgi:hypothetical protein